MATFHGWEWIVILVIVVLVFGVGRISKISGEIGSSIRSFRKGIKGDEETPADETDDKSSTKS